MDMKTVNNMVCLVKLDILESAEELQEILSRETAIVFQAKTTGIILILNRTSRYY